MGMKITVKSTINAATGRQISDAVHQAMPDMIKEIAEDAAWSMSRHLDQRRSDWLSDREQALANQKAPVELLNSIKSYLKELNAEVVEVNDRRTEVRVVMDKDKQTEVGYSLDRISRLMEFGGHILVGTKRYEVPPHPHWSTLVDAARRSAFNNASVWMRRLMAEVQTRLSVIRPAP